MVPTVVFVLALAASGFSLPVTTEVETVQQILTEVPVAQFVEKTGVESSPEAYSQIGQVQTNAPVPKVENVPVNVEQQQASYHENPVFLPVQPLSVVPAVQVGQVPRPIIVPAEAISAGRVIIAGIEPVQQRNFAQEVVNVENPVPYQQVTHPVTYTQVQDQGVQPNQQPYFVQPNEKQTPVQQGVVPAGQEYVPVQVQTYSQSLVKEQTVVPVNFVQGNVEQVHHYNAVPVQYPQGHIPEGIQVEKYVPYQVGSGYVPTHTAQYPVQQAEEKQGYHQGSGYIPVQNQGVVPENHQYQPYTGTPVVAENVEKNVPQQQYTEHQQQVYNVQQAEKHGEYQQVNSYTPVQNQPVTQQVYNAQQVVEKHGQYQTQTVEPQQQQVQAVQQGVESQVPVQRIQPVDPAYQQQVYNPQTIQPAQTHPVETGNKQQVYSVQPVVQQVVSEVPYLQSVQQQTVDYTPEVGSKSFEHQQQPYVPQEQVVNYASETAYNYGDKIQQQTPVVPQIQGTSVQSSVISPQE